MTGAMNKVKQFLVQICNYPKRIINKNISLFALVKNSSVSKKSRISPFTKFYSSKIDDYSYIGWNTIITDTEIGKYCSIAGDCVVGGASHPIEWVSTSPVFYSGKNIFGVNFTDKKYYDIKKTQIKNDVWIAANVVIKQGVKIENGAVIGMGSVLTKDVGPYEIWAGNPAKKIGNRFSEDIINKINRSKWWTFEEEYIKEISMEFDNIYEFLKKMENNNNENTTY